MSSGPDSQSGREVTSKRRQLRASRQSPLSRTLPPTCSSSPSQGASQSPSTPISLDDDNSSISSGCRKRRWESPIWANYDIIEADKFPDGIPRAICKFCKGGPLLANSSNGTSNFKRHTENCHARVSGDVAQMLLAKDGTLAKKIDPSIYKEKVALAIIRHAYPFTFAEHEANVDIHAYLNENIKPISRNTAKNLVMKIHKRERVRLEEQLKKHSGKVCLTCDMWTSIVSQGYLSLTAHWIDNEWDLHAKILNFCHVEPPHNAIMLHDSILSHLKDWGIEKNVFSITLDNARCNDNMQDMLVDSLSMHSSLLCDGEYFHVRCSAHILNLIVQSGLSVIKEEVLKVRKLVVYVTASEARILKFKEIALAAGIDCSRGLLLDCTTRWNSTYKLLTRASTYRVAFSNMRRMHRSDSHLPTPPLEEEWLRLERICALLKPFDEITNTFSGRKYPTSNLYLRKVWKIQSLLTKYATCEDHVIREMARSMKVKFEKYWDSYSLILSFAAILDPRYKLQLVWFCFNDLDEELVDLKLKNVKDKMHKLFEEYVKDTPQAKKTDATSEKVDDDLVGFSNVDSGFSSGGKTELYMYLEEYRLDHKLDLDVLQWWKENQKRFPIVAKMARDLLAIPITTVASESAFSMGGRILTKWRASLYPETAEALHERQEDEGLEIEICNDAINIDEEKMNDD